MATLKSLELFALLLLVSSAKWRLVEGKDLFGKPCTNNTSSEDQNLAVCDSLRNMKCTGKGICECAPSTEFKQTEYDKEALACFPVPNSGDSFRCQTNFQCKVSSYGQHSRCDFDNGFCTCYHDTAPVELVSNVCYLVRPIPLGDNYPSCEVNPDCTGSFLGNMSQCNLASRKCECYDTVTKGKNEVGYYNGVCIYKRTLGDFCDKDDECRVGYHKNAVCRESEAYLPGEKICECPKEGACDDGNGSPRLVWTSNSVILIGLTTLTLGIVAERIII